MVLPPQLEIRCRRNADGSFSAQAFASEQVFAIDLEGVLPRGSCDDIRLYLGVLRKTYPQVKFSISGPCADCGILAAMLAD
jgi:hypothetical protein